MYISKRIYIAFVVAIMAVTAFNSLTAQETVKVDSLVNRKKSLVLQIGGGISTYAATINIRPIELPGSITRNTGSATIRLMWYPNHRLRIGLESGYTSFYSYKVKNGNTPGSVNLTAVPLFIVWSMPIVKRVNIYAGFGSFFLTSHLKYNGQVNSHEFVLGSNIALSYTKPISKRAGIAAEAKWMSSFETRDTQLGVQVQLVWKLLQWQ